MSALDVSIQAQILNLLMTLRQEVGVAYLFISHDLSVVGHISDRIAVMYLGRIVETGSRDAVLRRTAHPYTRALFSAVPGRAAEDRIALSGEPPSPLAPPPGCPFHPRCPSAVDRCAQERPTLRRIAANHDAACHLIAA